MFFTACHCCDQIISNYSACPFLLLQYVSWDMTRFIEIITMTMFGCCVVGILFSLFIITLILYEKLLRTSYGLLCLSQSIANTLLFLTTIIVEISYRLVFGVNHEHIFLLQWMYSLASNIADLCYPNFMTNMPRSYFCPKQFAGFIKFTTISFIIIIRLLKASNRFVAMYFPIHYQKKFTNKNTLYLIVILASLFIVIHSPILLSQTNCQINLDVYGFSYQNTCTSLYNSIETIIEIVVYITCWALDIACLVKLRKMLKDPTASSNAQDRKRDKILIFQNIGNLTAIILSFIPYGIYALITCECQFVYSDGAYSSSYWNQMFLTGNIWMTFYYMNTSSVKRVIGHTVEEMITLFLQGRVTQIKVETEYTQVVSRNIITIHKEPNKFVKLCTIIILNLIAFFKSFLNVFKRFIKLD